MKLSRLFIALLSFATLSLSAEEVRPAAPVPAPATPSKETPPPAPAAAPAKEEKKEAPAVEAPKPAPSAAAEKTPLPSTPDVIPIPTKAVPEDKIPLVQGDYTGKVVIIKVGKEDLISPARFEFMSRTLKRATAEGAEAVVFDLDTPGGLAWDTITFIMDDLQKLGCKSVSFVNPRALSAGAIIAMGTDAVYMSPASSIGAATPVSGDGQELGEAERAKMNSAIMAMARTVAKNKGHNPAVIEAMIDKDLGLKIGDEEVLAKGRILTLDQEQAVKVYNGRPLLAKGVVRNLTELLAKEGLKGETIVAEPKGFEQVAIWITKYAAILILIGLAAGYLEMQHPGLGLPGAIAAIAFGTFFFGHYVAGSLVGYETLVIFLIGIALIIVELFLFPGHVLPGLIGLLMIFGSLLYTMAGWDFTVPEGKSIPTSFDYYAVGLRNLGLAFAGAIAVILLLMRYLPSTGPFNKFVLETAVGGAQGSIEGYGQERASTVQVGATGLTRSALRPYGHVEFDGVQVEAMVEGDYIMPNTQVRVKSVQGGKMVVERAYQMG